MADYRAKKAALQQRLKALDADEKRIAGKRAQAEAEIAECDRMLTQGGEKPETTKRSKRSS